METPHLHSNCPSLCSVSFPSSLRSLAGYGLSGQHSWCWESLSQLTDGWEPSPACRENCPQTEEFNPILLKPYFHNFSPTDISSVRFFFYLECFFCFFTHWTFFTSSPLPALMHVVQTSSVSHLLCLFSIKLTSIFSGNYPGSGERCI